VGARDEEGHGAAERHGPVRPFPLSIVGSLARAFEADFGPSQVRRQGAAGLDDGSAPQLEEDLRAGASRAPLRPLARARAALSLPRSTRTDPLLLVCRTWPTARAPTAAPTCGSPSSTLPTGATARSRRGAAPSTRGSRQRSARRRGLGSTWRAGSSAAATRSGGRALLSGELALTRRSSARLERASPCSSRFGLLSLSLFTCSSSRSCSSPRSSVSTLRTLSVSPGDRDAERSAPGALESRGGSSKGSLHDERRHRGDRRGLQEDLVKAKGTSTSYTVREGVCRGGMRGGGREGEEEGEGRSRMLRAREAGAGEADALAGDAASEAQSSGRARSSTSEREREGGRTRTECCPRPGRTALRSGRARRPTAGGSGSCSTCSRATRRRGATRRSTARAS